MIPFEDAGGLAQKAVKRLLSERKALNLPRMRIQPITEFLQTARKQKLTAVDRQVICDQAILIIEQFYAHLPFKRARYAIDPVQRIRLLRARLGQIDDDLEFHSELLHTFAEMRDAHTSYRLPPPYTGAIAFLPFYLQPYFDRQQQRRFLVTDVLDGFEHPYFQPGVEVTQWNGMPVARAVEVLAEHIPGGNAAARFARGMMRMTVRSLASTLPPDEEVVFVRYRGVGAKAEERIMQLPWYAGTGMGTDFFHLNGSSVCEPLKDLSIVREVLWRREEWKVEQACQCHPELTKKSPPLVTKLPDVFQVQHPEGLCDSSRGFIEPICLSREAKRFGYIRIKTFQGDPDAIFGEFQRLLRHMQRAAPDGLILDVRGNAGGNINAAERMLQLLTPAEIAPALFHFVNTPAIQKVIARLQQLVRSPETRLSVLSRLDDVAPYFEDWFSDRLEAVASGTLLTSGRPITSPEDANDTGQIYFGPVALLIDAASYSATDTFAAGFQDHAIGEIIGVDDNTGGGGASRWMHSQELVQRLKGLVDIQPPLEPLPAGASMALALQRSARVGASAGEPVEDVGVKCDIPYRLTKADLLEDSKRLILFACRVLSKKPSYRLEIIHKERTPTGIRLKVKTKNIDRLVCLLDGHPELTVQARGSQWFHVPLGKRGHASAHDLRIRGYAMVSSPGTRKKTQRLVAAAKVRA